MVSKFWLSAVIAAAGLLAVALHVRPALAGRALMPANARDVLVPAVQTATAETMPAMRFLDLRLRRGVVLHQVEAG